MADKETKKLETKRRIYLTATAILLMLVIILCIVGFTSLKNGKGMPSYFLTIGAFVSMMCAVFLIASINLMTSLRKNFMTKYITDILQNYYYVPDRGIKEEVFRRSKFISKYDKYLSSDYVAGNLNNNNKFSMCNISVFTKNPIENAKDMRLFKGVFAVLTSDIKNDELDIKIYPDFRNKYMNQVAMGLKKLVDTTQIVRLENAEFERYFEVYSPDQIEARKKLTLEFMEKLLIYAKKIKKRITIFYVGGIVFLFIENYTIIKDIKLFFKGFDEKLIQGAKNNIKEIYELMSTI